MGVRWVRLAEAQRSRFVGMCERERFAYFLALQYGCEAGGGADGAEQVAVALCAATGLVVRSSADGLMKEVFTERNPGEGSIQAAFFVTRKDRCEAKRIARKGTATHVAGVVGRGVVVSFERPRAAFRTLDELWTLCELWDYSLSVRGLDMGALARRAEATGGLGEVEARLAEYFEEARE